MINMIVAVSKNGVIGKDNGLPWRISEDLKAFKTLTMGSTLYVGKKTAENLPPLRGREVKILQRNGYPSLDTIAEHHSCGCKTPCFCFPDIAWIIGGAAIYKAALDMDIVDKVYLTIIDHEYDGDTFLSFDQFQQFQNTNWLLTNMTILREKDPIVTLQEWSKR